jgi:hypothetical protein
MLIQVTMSPEQLLVINQFLKYTRLGQQTNFGNAVTDLALALEQDFSEGCLDMFQNEFGTPSIQVTFDEDEGMVFEVL